MGPRRTVTSSSVTGFVAPFLTALLTLFVDVTGHTARADEIYVEPEAAPSNAPATAATDETVTATYARPPAWGAKHPVAIGTRMNARVADGYDEAGLGGHLRIRPFHWVRLELFEDNFVGMNGGNLRHNHEVGTTIQFPLVDTGRFLLYPMIGACAMLAVLEPGGPGSSSPSATDIRFGLHGGAGGEVALGGGVSLELEIEAVGYAGHPLTAYDWTASVSPNLTYYVVGQATMGVNYWF